MNGLVEVVGHVLVHAVNQEAPGPRGGVAPRVHLEVTVVVGEAPNADVREVHRVLGAHREEHHRVGGDAQPNIYSR